VRSNGSWLRSVLREVIVRCRATKGGGSSKGRPTVRHDEAR
jgi:hypothetical protein